LCQLHNADIVLQVDGERRLTTGFVSQTQQVAPERVFLATMGAFDSTSNPGFDSAPFSLPAGATIGFDILAALSVWDGQRFWDDPTDAGFPAPLPNPVPLMRARLGPLMALSPRPGQTTAGFGFAVDDDGVYHHHLTFTLFSQASPPASPAEAGVYALQLRMWCSDPTIGPSDPFWIVFNQQADPAEQQRAADSLHAQLLTPACPADFNGDGLRNPDDLSEFITCFFLELQFPDFCPQGDFNGDGLRNPDDLSEFITVFFLGC
jgi:hypothetical protein